jgi:serine/threonine protein kinase
MTVDAARVKSLFLEASELADPAERAAYLERECGADAGLRQRVEALLAADDGGGRSVDGDAIGTSELTSPETQEASATVEAATRQPSELATAEDRSDGADFTIASAPRVDRPGGSGVGQVIAGRYSVREVLGEGGMGTVYRADQAAPVKRQVAIKLIKIGMDSRAVLARFDAERQALALMDHPHIARVYDGGTTEVGQPFFVMELVSGVPITDYCDRKRLPVRARLELFVSVCQAVQHAHQKGIIHRDLKPSNVMVTEVDGRATPKVIDFGVAKATEFKLTDQSLADTGAIVGTPTYMSPEQADPSSMDIDTRTDVYALGVILYELLVGSPPIDARQFKRGAILEMLRMVREVDPPKPSTKVSTSDALPSIAASRDVEPAHLKRALLGDLDWVVMKALEKDRTRRYETANGFAADILRHLAHEPVLAAPPSRAYRLRKFVRKHRGAVIAASLVLVALVGGVIGTTAGLFEARRQAEIARGKEREANEEKHKALRAVEEERQANRAYTALIGQVQAVKSSTPESQDLKRLILLQAVKGLESRIVRMDEKKEAFNLRDLADAHLRMGWLYREIGQTDQAYKQFEESHKIRENISQANPNEEDARIQLAHSWRNLGDHAINTKGDVARARENYKRGLTIAKDLAEHPKSDQPPLMDRKQLVADLYYSLGDIADGPVEAREYYTQSLKRRQEWIKANPEVVLPIMRVADCYHDLAKAAFHSRDLAAARGHFDECLKLRDEALRRQPENFVAKLLLAFGHERLGDFQVRTGNPEEGKKSLLNAQARYQALLDADPKNEDIKKHLSRARYLLGTAYLRLQEKQLAAQTYADALKMRQALAEKDWANLPKQKDYMVNLARCGQHQAAAKKADEIYKKSPKDVDTLLNLMRCYALCSAAVGGSDGKPAPTAEQANLRDTYAAKAANCLKEAIAKGFRNAVDVETDVDIDAIRKYPAFELALDKLQESVQR